jgi:hypothetical protein
MEVHAHAHTERKKWTHYFWEFFMLFLAVFCGFMAENTREHFLENHREKQFISSLIEDLKLDIKNLDSINKRREYRTVMIDSLTLLLNSPDPDQYGNQVYYYARWLTYFYQFINNDRTIQQLKYSGNFRLIEKQEVSDRIMSYDQQIRWIEPTNKREEVFIENYVIKLEEMFDSDEFDRMLDKKYGFRMPADNPRLLNKEKNKLQELKSSIHFLKAINNFIMNWLNNQKSRAQAMLIYIQKEYHLE